MRAVFCAVSLLLIGARAFAQGHEGHEQGPNSNPLACDVASGEKCFDGPLDDFQAAPSTTEAIGHAYLVLNAARTEIRYRIVLDELLSMKQDPAQRTEPDDVIGMHFHRYVPDTYGPHILNIFGLATWGVPAQEDADLVVDYEYRTLTGVYDIGDATIDPATGQPFPAFFPLTSKVIDDWLDELELGLWMVAVHTNESGFPNMAIHGHIGSSVPEPTAGVLVAAAGAGCMMFRFNRRGKIRVT